MSKHDFRKVSSAERKQMLDHLITLLMTAAHSRKDMQQFLQRLLTPSEMVMLGRRLQIAALLTEGRSYDHIKEELNVGVTTIRAVARWLEYAVGNYQEIAREQQREEKMKKARQKRTPRRRNRGGEYLLIDLLFDS